MKFISIHVSMMPQPTRIVGILVFDEEGFDYAPVVREEKGLLFADKLRTSLNHGLPPHEALEYFFDKGGPHQFESLSTPEFISGSDRIEAMRSQAQAREWALDWDASVQGVRLPPEPLEVPGPVPGLTRSLKQAMAMKTIAELLRRHHHPLMLRVFELHPGGGTYDCLALVPGRCEPSLCSFNLEGTGLLLQARGEPRPPDDAGSAWHDDTWRYPEGYLAAGDARAFADRVEARLGLPQASRTPSSSPSTIGVSVLAQLAERYALSRAAPSFRSGWHDSSGALGSQVRSWVSDYPHVQRRCDAAADWIGQALAAGRLMGICGEKDRGEPQVVVDLGSGEVYHSGSPLGSLWKRYQKGEGIRAIAWWLETQWRSRSKQ